MGNMLIFVWLAMRFVKGTGDVLKVAQGIWSGQAMKTDEQLIQGNSWNKNVIKIEKISNNDLHVSYETKNMCQYCEFQNLLFWWCTSK